MMDVLNDEHIKVEISEINSGQNCKTTNDIDRMFTNYKITLRPLMA